MSEPTKASDDAENFKKLTLGIGVYTALMFVLWVFGAISISFAWVIGPAAYITHLFVQAGMIRTAVQTEIEKAFADMEMPEELVTTTFHDATPYEGSLN